MHARLARGLVPLLAIAGRAGGDDVLPHRQPAATARDHVVDGEAGGLAPAVLAGPRVAGEHSLAGDLAAMHVARDAHVPDEPDHAGPLEGEALRMEGALAALEDLRALLQHEHRGAPDVADVDRFVARVEDEDPAADAHVRVVAVQVVPVAVDVRLGRTSRKPRSALASKAYVRVGGRVHSATIV